MSRNYVTVESFKQAVKKETRDFIEYGFDEPPINFGRIYNGVLRHLDNALDHKYSNLDPGKTRLTHEDVRDLTIESTLSIGYLLPLEWNNPDVKFLRDYRNHLHHRLTDRFRGSIKQAERNDQRKRRPKSSASYMSIRA